MTTPLKLDRRWLRGPSCEKHVWQSLLLSVSPSLRTPLYPRFVPYSKLSQLLTISTSTLGFSLICVGLLFVFHALCSSSHSQDLISTIDTALWHCSSISERNFQHFPWKGKENSIRLLPCFHYSIFRVTCLQRMLHLHCVPHRPFRMLFPVINMISVIRAFNNIE